LDALVTDNGANMVSVAGRLGDNVGLRCAAHTIQLVLRDAAREQPMAGLLHCVMTVLTRFRNSVARRQALCDAAKRAGIKALMPLHPIVTRWDSNYHALRRFLQIYPALERMSYKEWGVSSVADHIRAWTPVTDAQPILPALCDVLKAFARWTRELQSASRVTISLIPAAVQDMLAATAAHAGDHDGIAMIKKQLQDAACRRLAASPLVQIARYLDPTQHKGALGADSTDVDDLVFKMGQIVDDTVRATRHPDATQGRWVHAFSSYNGWPASQLHDAVAKYHDCGKAWRARRPDLVARQGKRAAPAGFSAFRPRPQSQRGPSRWQAWS
jgi:hypothetical protein